MSKKLKVNKKLKPFHVSIIEQLKNAEKRLSLHHNIGLFVNRFVVEVETVSNIIQVTIVPQEFVGVLITELETFREEFELNYPRVENGCGCKRDRDFIDDYFRESIENLKERFKNKE